MITLPEATEKELIATLETLRNNITLNDAEVVRLKKLASSEGYKVQQLHNEKEFIEKEIAKKQDEKKILEFELEKLNSGKKDLEKDLSGLNQEIEKSKQSLKEVRVILESEDGIVKLKIKELKERESKIKSFESEISKKKIDLALSQKTIASQIEKINIAKSLIKRATEGL